MVEESTWHKWVKGNFASPICKYVLCRRKLNYKQRLSVGFFSVALVRTQTLFSSMEKESGLCLNCLILTHAASDLGLHCLLMFLLWDARHKWVRLYSQAAG